MDPQKISSPSSDSDKPQENTSGSAAGSDPKPWGTDAPHAPADDTKPADTVASGNDSSDAKPAETDGGTPADSFRPEAPMSAPITPGAEVTAAVPPAPSPSAPAPATPSWPGAPVIASPSMPASVVGGVPSTKSKKGLLIGLVLAVVVLIIGGGAAAAYFGYVVPNKPENVLKTALVNNFTAGKVDSQHFNGKVSVTDKQSNMTLSGTFTGGSTAKGAFELQADVDAVVTKITLDARSIDGSSLYLRVGGLEGLPELLGAYGGDNTEASAYASVIAALNNQWIEINESVLNQLGVGDMGTFKLTDADRQKIADAYVAHQFLSIQEKLKDEKISGMDSYHYKVAINKAELKDFMVALKDAKLDSLKLTQDDIAQFNDAVKNVDFTKFPVDVWISKDQKLIDQVTFNYSDKDAALTARLTVLDYKPVTVTKPAGAKSLLEVISQMYSKQSDAALMQELQSNGISL